MLVIILSDIDSESVGRAANELKTEIDFSSNFFGDASVAVRDARCDDSNARDVDVADFVKILKSEIRCQHVL